MLVIIMFAGALACDVRGFFFNQVDRPLFVMEAGHELGFVTLEDRSEKREGRRGGAARRRRGAVGLGR